MYCHEQELEAVMKELATLEGVIRETAAQVEPFKQAKEAAKKAHKVLNLPIFRLRVYKRTSAAM